jgi:hypothetical protein
MASPWCFHAGCRIDKSSDYPGMNNSPDPFSEDRFAPGDQPAGIPSASFRPLYLACVTFSTGQDRKKFLAILVLSDS